MWTRRELKDQAKLNLKGKYWSAFAVTLLLGLLGGGSPAVSFGSFKFDFKFGSKDFDFSQPGEFRDFFYNNQELISGILLAAIVFGLLAFLFALGFNIFVSSVVQVGGNRWFSRSRESAATPAIGQLFSLFKGGNYLKTVGGMLWLRFLLFLWGLLPLVPWIAFAAIGWQQFDLPAYWPQPGDSIELWLNTFADSMYTWLPFFGLAVLASILFSIPCLIKSYSYRMAPWILADNPRIGCRRALRLSMDLTRGHKFNIWVLDLSFIGWWIAGVLLCGIGTLFVLPYFYAVQAELFADLRMEGTEKGLCTMEELGYVRAEPQAAVAQQPIS